MRIRRVLATIGISGTIAAGVAVPLAAVTSAAPAVAAVSAAPAYMYHS